jgi:hypothetical protein
MLCLLVLIFFMAGHNHSSAQRLLTEGRASVVEGPVENFEATRGTNGRVKNMDRFSVRGVRFEYSDASYSAGYHKVSAHGGAINRNGLYVRIHYAHIPGDPIDPTILKLQIRRE